MSATVHRLDDYRNLAQSQMPAEDIDQTEMLARFFERIARRIREHQANGRTVRMPKLSIGKCIVLTPSGELYQGENIS